MQIDELDISTEEQLLLKLSNLTFSHQQQVRVRELVAIVNDWSGFVHLANEHGISALVCNNLKDLGILANLPDKEVSYLESTYLKSLSRNVILQDRLEELYIYLNEIGIKPVLLKGMALELTVYGNMGLRQMNDIDIFIDRDDCLKAWNYLVEKGYTPKPLKSSLHKKLILDIGKHLPELYKDGISFEIHHTLFEPDSLALSAEALAKAETAYQIIEVDGHNHQLLPIELHYIYLVKHLHYHETDKAESQIRLYNDLCQVMMQCTRDIKSSGILELAQQHNLEDILFMKFYILHVFWGMPLPEEIESALSEDQKHIAINKFTRYLRSPKGNKVTERGKTFRKTLKGIPGLGRKIRYIIGDLFPSVGFMQKRYKTRTRVGACFHYPLRLGKILLLFIR